MAIANDHRTLPLTGLLLAGGAGRRMQQQDKGWVEYQGRPLLHHSLRPLERHAREILISANRNQERYSALGYPVLADAESGFPGPLHGLLAGLAVAQQDWLAFVPVDAPALPDDLLWQLWVRRKGVPLVLAEDEHAPIPVIGLMHRRLTRLLQYYLDSGERRAGAFFAKIPQHRLPLAPAATLNCNRPEDLQGTIA